MTAHSPPLFRAAFDRTLRLSPFVRRSATAHPDGVALLESRESRGYSREEMRAMLAPGDDLGSRLRLLRERVMVTLAHRDLNGLAPLAEVFDTMTALAEECIGAACAEAHRRIAALHGEPAGGAPLIVAGLGKLGGGELNVSSDVDLVFLYGEDGDTAGPRGVTHHEFFADAGRALIALLAEITHEGQAFRVDMRLRPFGDSGPLVTSLSSLEDYFIGHARPWERYAWLKSRVITGPADGVRERVEPFVYRRYLDYGMLDALRDMHARIFDAAVQRRKADDIKVGAGGIREIEFAAQLFQMIRGGRDAGLRTTSTRAALAAIAERALMEPERVALLTEAYTFLRRLEHRLQYYDDQQTQALPRTPEHQALIAESMDFPDYGAMLAELDRHRKVVQEAFNALFESNAQRDASVAPGLTASLSDPQATPELESVAEELAALGITESAAVAKRLIEFTRSRRFRGLSAGSRAKLEKLLPAIVTVIASQGGTEALAMRLISLLEAIDRREAYFALLLEYPRVLERAARLMAKSAWAARLLARHPILLDELTRSAASFIATDWALERQSLAAECAQVGDDVERFLDHLRHYKQRHILRLTIADLEGEITVMALSDELSALADTILDVMVQHDTGIEGFCVVGYGKLGGKELGYGSDLDIIFLYDEALAGQAEKFARTAQRINTWITSHTSAGILYDLDLRLRPDGAKGLMVTSMTGFREYQLKRAWTWEHQALTRARACAGDRTVGARFEALRDELLAMPRDRAKLFDEIIAMRKRMRAERKHDASELKHTDGGVIDLEFCVQALVLAEGPQHPTLRENKGNHTLLKRAADLGLLKQEIAIPAANAYLAMRKRIHQAALNDDDKVKLAAGELETERAAVRALWKAVFD